MAAMDEVARLKEWFRRGREDLFPAGARTAPCRDLMSRHADLIDSILAEIYRISCACADLKSTRTSRSGLCILATGGYGRRELSPFSDVDIAFVPSEEQDPWVEAAVHEAFKRVMDVFLSFREIHVGYSFRPISEISTWDLPTRISLLDARHLCGDRSLAERMQEQVALHLSPCDILLEVRQLRARPHAAIHAVEPNIKEGEGGLRSLHRARWIYRLLLGVSDAQLFPELNRTGLLSAERTAEIEAATEWFFRARNWLHVSAGKRSDVLMSNYQDRIAQELEGMPAQEWLSIHYAHAETLARFQDAAVRHTLAGPVNLGGIELVEGVLTRQRFYGIPDPDRAVLLIHLAQRYEIPIGIADEQDLEDERARALAVSRPSDTDTRAFLGILREGRGVAAALRMLVRYGLLNRFIESFDLAMRFAPPDPAHRNSVGEHSLRIVEELECLRDGSDGADPHFAELAAQCSHFDMLYLAALVHDAGKLVSERDHSEASAEIATQVAQRLRLAPEKQELLELLTGQHLLLVRTGRLHDLKSPSLIQNIAEKIPSVDALRHLYLFTYVDTRAVGEKNWTTMDDRDLELLFLKIQAEIEGEIQEIGTERVEGRIGEIRHTIARSSDPQSDEAVRRHCDAMPASYILNTPLEEIAFHIKLLARLEAEGVVLDLYNRPGDDYSELTVCAYDDPQPGMLAKITGALYGCEADIQRAQVFTLNTQKPVVLDMLWIRSAGIQVSEARGRRIVNSLRDILSGRRSLDLFLQGAGKHPPSGILLDGVDLRNDISEEHTVVHVIARDLQGLLYLMTRALSRAGLHIHSARVATWTGRAENTFYVTTLDGKQIPGEDLQGWQESLSRTLEGIEKNQ